MEVNPPNTPITSPKVARSVRILGSIHSLPDPARSKMARHIIVTTTMFTPGGSHLKVEIPEILDHLRPQHAGVELRYAWPFGLKLVANTLTEQVKRFS